VYAQPAKSLVVCVCGKETTWNLIERLSHTA
jgi:hypothetical protein